MPSHDAQDFDNLLGEIVDELAMQPMYSAPRPVEPEGPAALDASLQNTGAHHVAANAPDPAAMSHAATAVPPQAHLAPPPPTSGASSVAITGIIAGALATVAVAAMVILGRPGATPDPSPTPDASTPGPIAATEATPTPPEPIATPANPLPAPDALDAAAAPAVEASAEADEATADEEAVAEPKPKPKRTKRSGSRTKTRTKKADKPSGGGMSFEDL